MHRIAWIPPWVRGRRVLGMNARNLVYVHGLNRRRYFPLADDKVLTKSSLVKAGVSVPETLAVVSNLAGVDQVRTTLESAGEFVLKPARGRQGSGIFIVTGCEGGLFRGRDDQLFSWEALRRAMGDILFGVHSFGSADRVLVERRVRSLSELGGLAAMGLPDIRVIVLHGRPVMSMMRVPTRASGGRANLHQGAVGVALRISDGLAVRAVIRGELLSTHPDNGVPLSGFRIPDWKRVVDAALAAAAALPLPYLGVDVVLSEGSGPLVMEVNVRPGLEIQNVNARGLRRPLERIASRAGRTR